MVTWLEERRRRRAKWWRFLGCKSLVAEVIFQAAVRLNFFLDLDKGNHILACIKHLNPWDA